MEMYAVLYAVLCWGKSFRGHHIVFHNNNKAVYSTLNSLTVQSPDMMDLFHQILQFACILDFSFLICLALFC